MRFKISIDDELEWEYIRQIVALMEEVGWKAFMVDNGIIRFERGE